MVKWQAANRMICSLNARLVPSLPPDTFSPNSCIMAVMERSTGITGDCCLITWVQT